MDGKIEGVSFVVTAYNKERYLEATLKSILAQEGDFDWEFIVVDDSSTDRSVEIAENLIGSLANGRVVASTCTRGGLVAPRWPGSWCSRNRAGPPW